MKTLVFLIFLCLMFFLAGCQDSGVADPEPLPEPTDRIEQLNKRSKELFTQGKGVVDAANIIKSEFDLEDFLLLGSLHKAGYSAGDVVKASRLSYHYQSRHAETVLRVSLQNVSNEKIAEMILYEFITELGQNDAALKYFIAQLTSLDKIIDILKNIYEKNVPEILALLKDLNVDLVQLIQRIQTQFVISKEDLKQILLAFHYKAEDIARVFREVFNESAQEFAGFLHQAGYEVQEILIALKNEYHLTLIELAEILEKFGYQVDEIIVFIKALGFTYRQIAELLKDYYNLTAPQAAELLKQINASVSEIAQVLKELYNLGALQTAEILKDLGYNMENIVSVLENYFGLITNEIIEILLSIGFNYCDVLNFFGISC